MSDVAPEKENKGNQWKVFVSSTSAGMAGFRTVAYNVISNFRYSGIQCFTPVVMEEFGAQDGPAREVCADKVSGCDVLVGIIGVRYGAHPPDDQTSYTELEYETAVEKRISRLMFLLDEKVAGELEGVAPQGEDRADRQAQFRQRVGTDRVSDMTVGSVEDFRARLVTALGEWVENESFKRKMVDHDLAFREARARLLRAANDRTGEATLIFGAPGTGKTTLVTTLLNDMPVKQAYDHLIGPFPVRLAQGPDEIRQWRAQVQAALDDLAAQQSGGRTTLPPVLIVLYLEPDVRAGRLVTHETLAELRELFTWDVPRAVVLAETNNHAVRERLERDLGWRPGTVITVDDYSIVDDAMEQMRLDAPEVKSWPQPETRQLAEALGLRPLSLYTAAKDIEAETRRNPRRVARHIRNQLEAVASAKSAQGKHDALIRGSIDSLTEPARDLLQLMTVLHPKPTLFPDDMAVALDLSLEPDDAIKIISAEDDDDLDDDQLDHRDQAEELVGELVERGLLERQSAPGRARPGDPPLLTLHPANVRAIRACLPLTGEQTVTGHARAEAFYRTQVGENVSGSFDKHFRMEDHAWGDSAEEWLYHLAGIAPGRAGIVFAALVLDTFWWWDLFVKFDFSDRLLDYAYRPLVRQGSPDLPKVADLLTRFRDTYRRSYDAAVAWVHAGISGGDLARVAALRDSAAKAAGILPILRELCDLLKIAELDALFTDAGPDGAAGAGDAADTSEADETRLHLLGVICLVMGEGHSFRAEADPDSAASVTAEACYRRAESYFLANDDPWEVAWARNLLGVVISARGGDPAPEWDACATGAANEGDTELLALVEQGRGNHLLSHDDVEGALAHYGRAVFYALSMQVTSNLNASADPYTQAFYRQVALEVTEVLADPVLDGGDEPLDDRVAEARRRLAAMLAEWGGTWQPDPARLEAALRSATRAKPEATANAILDAAFPPGPGDAVLGVPGSSYYDQVNARIAETVSQPWVQGMSRWQPQRE